MREFKFRAWDEGNKVMHYNFQFVKSGNEGNDWILFTSDKQPISEYDKWIKNPYSQLQLKIMQWTGLHDKNGKEIYEGDILKTESGFTGKLYYWQGNYKIDKPSPYGHWRLHANICYCDRKEHAKLIHINGEVIGNLYENPELKAK